MSEKKNRNKMREYGDGWLSVGWLVDIFRLSIVAGRAAVADIIKLSRHLVTSSKTMMTSRDSGLVNFFYDVLFFLATSSTGKREIFVLFLCAFLPTSQKANFFVFIRDKL